MIRKFRKYIFFIMPITMCACLQTKVDYKHVVVDEETRIEIIERSTESLSSDGRRLKGQKVGLPTLSVLREDNYVITIETSLNPGPTVFLRANSKMGDPLILQGKHLIDVARGIEDYKYTFKVRTANGAPIEFDIIDAQGVVIGQEKISYKVISRGYIWVADSL